MTSTVVVNDFASDRQFTLIFNDTDFTRANEFWDQEDKLLNDLQSEPYFKGKLKWSDLDPTHFQLMLLRVLTKVNKLQPDERGDLDHPVMMGLTFLLTSLIKCLEMRTGCQVELLKLQRLSDTDILYDFAASLNMRLDNPSAPTGIRVIVDNT
jgi:hypothetical protein